MSKLFRRREQGQAVVEFALAAPFLLMFVFFIADIGFVAYSSITATSAMREAARCAAVGGTDAAITTRITSIGGGLATVGTPSIDRHGEAIGDEVSVEADFSYDWITPVGLVPGLSGTLDFTREAVMRLETAEFTRATC